MYEYKQAKTVVTDLQYFVFAKIFHCKVLNSCTVLYNDYADILYTVQSVNIQHSVSLR